jgi:20S proteasome alpha/beta subunit
MDIHHDDDKRICQQTVREWYSLWTQWIRGLTERKKLVEAWKSLVVAAVDDEHHRRPFLWIDSSGVIWKNLSFLTDDLILNSETTTREDDMDMDEGAGNHYLWTKLSRSYSGGVTWNGIQTSTVDWQVFPIVGDEEGSDMKRSHDHPRFYIVICRVKQEIDRGGDDHPNESQVVVLQTTAVVQIQEAAIEKSTHRARLVQLQETPVVHEKATFISRIDSLAHQRKAMMHNSNNVPSRHRYIAPPNILDQYGAKPMLVETVSSQPVVHPTSDVDGTTASNTMAVTNSSDLVGISIQGWNIATSQGFIGDQNWFEEATSKLEPLAQYRGSDTIVMARKLVLPEMVFPLAHVVLERNSNNSTSDSDDDDTVSGLVPQNDQWQKEEADIFVVWDAMDALQEWSHAHQAIPVPKIETRSPLSTTNKATSNVSYRGVSVLESSDASLWKQKDKTSDDKNDGAPPIGSTEFHYDWTYSTPFAGNIFVSGQPIKRKKESSSYSSWKPLPQSGMPMYLLTDTSAPILYYDHIVLYEDDLHDNGAVEYSVKVRIMPHCAYVLARLFVRVDHVLVRLREARWLIEFPTSQDLVSKHCPNRTDGTKIYRDITWREAAWQDLGPRYQLPSQVQAWTTTSASRETQAFQMLLSKLPMVDLPSDTDPYAEMPYPNIVRKNNKKKKTSIAKVGASSNSSILCISVMLVFLLSMLQGQSTNSPSILVAASDSDTSSYVSVRTLDKFGNAKQVSYALEAAKRQGRTVIVAVVKGNSIASTTSDGDATESTLSSHSFVIAVSLGTTPILHSLQITPPGETICSFLAVCCTGIKADANWLIRQLQTFSATIWERYNIPSNMIATPTVAHVVARLMGRFAGYDETREWSSSVGLPGRTGDSNDNDDEDSQSSRWARPLGIQTMIISTAASSAPRLLQIDPSGRILTPMAQTSSGIVSASVIGRDSDKIRSRLVKLFEGKDGKSWEVTSPTLEECEEWLVKIMLDETSLKKGVDQVQVETFSSASGQLERKSVTI